MNNELIERLGALGDHLDDERATVRSMAAPPVLAEGLTTRDSRRRLRSGRRVLSRTAAAAAVIASVFGIAIVRDGQNARVSTNESGVSVPVPVEVDDVPLATAKAPAPTRAPALDEVSTSVPVGFIPDPEGPYDPRDPIQRFLGVPADVEQSSEWSDRAQGRAVVECMAARGFVLDESTWQTLGFDPSSEEDKALLEALRGSDGCEEIANRQTNLLPAAEAQFAELDRAIRSDQRAVEAAAAVQDCVDRSESSDPTVIPGECADVANRSNQVFAQLSEEYSPAWIFEHRDMLGSLRDRIAGLIERSGSPG